MSMLGINAEKAKSETLQKRKELGFKCNNSVTFNQLLEILRSHPTICWHSLQPPCKLGTKMVNIGVSQVRIELSIDQMIRQWLNESKRGSIFSSCRNI